MASAAKLDLYIRHSSALAREVDSLDRIVDQGVDLLTAKPMAARTAG